MRTVIKVGDVTVDEGILNLDEEVEVTIKAKVSSVHAIRTASGRKGRAVATSLPATTRTAWVSVTNATVLHRSADASKAVLRLATAAERRSLPVCKRCAGAATAEKAAAVTSRDPGVWARTFMEEFGDHREDITEESMLSWFANAMFIGLTSAYPEDR